MAKLYAELSSDKGGRVVGKGGDKFITFRLKEGNSLIATIDYSHEDKQLHINADTNTLETNVNGFIL